MPPAAEEESKDVFSRWSMTPSADPIEHGLLYKDLAKSTLVRLNRRQDVMGVSERLPQDGVHDRHRLPPDAIAGLGRDTHHGVPVHLDRPWSATSIVNRR
jgi:hypothetical protein